MIINATNKDFKELNEEIRNADYDCEINECSGQRYIGCGLSKHKLKVRGISGNALGTYLNGAEIETFGNAQDAVGDTMNEGRIIVHGNIGDAAGYAMRGGEIYVEKSAGYRAGIHMKAYKEKLPVMIIGGQAGSFLGEYQAGGIIIVLGLNTENGSKIVGNFPCTGMHGGKMFLRSSCDQVTFPNGVHARPATQEDLEEIKKYIENYAEFFGVDKDVIMESEFTIVTPDSKNPYKQMYVAN